MRRRRPYGLPDADERGQFVAPARRQEPEHGRQAGLEVDPRRRNGDFADFGDPLATTAYSVCIFDQGGNRLVLRSDVPAGGVCGTRACWRSLGPKGFKYKDSERTPDGIDSLRLSPGAAGKAKIKLKGRGSNLTLPALGLTTPARVQLQAGNGQCWEASYSSAIKNTTSQFKAKSD